MDWSLHYLLELGLFSHRIISLKVLFELFDLCFILSYVGASVAVKCKVGKSVPSFN